MTRIGNGRKRHKKHKGMKFLTGANRGNREGTNSHEARDFLQKEAKATKRTNFDFGFGLLPEGTGFWIGTEERELELRNEAVNNSGVAQGCSRHDELTARAFALSMHPTHLILSPGTLHQEFAQAFASTRLPQRPSNGFASRLLPRLPNIPTPCRNGF
jgi:hypothetical protein